MSETAPCPRPDALQRSTMRLFSTKRHICWRLRSLQGHSRARYGPESHVGLPDALLDTAVVSKLREPNEMNEQPTVAEDKADQFEYDELAAGPNDIQ